MKWNHFKSKLLLKYTFSYIAIFLIPLIILTVFIYQSAVQTLRSEIEQTNVNQMTQAKTVIDERMKELQDMASRIAYDEKLTSYWVHHPYYSREAIGALAKYKATSSIINELFLFFRGDEKIYSAQGLENLDVFNGRYTFHNWNKTDLIHDLNTMSFPMMRPAEKVDQGDRGQQSMLAYLVPITPNNPTPHGTVMFLINESNLTDLIESILSDYHGMTYIFDNNGQVLAANHQGETITATDVNALFRLEPGTHSLSLNNEPHSVVSVKSDAGWTYVTAMPSSQFFSRIVHIQTIIVLVFSLVVVMGTILAIILARKQYHPISDLMEFVRLKTVTDTPTSSNELEWIKKTLHDYSQRVDLQEPYARNHILQLLLKHGHTEEFTTEFKETLGIRFNRSHYFVVCMGWEAHAFPMEDNPDRRPVMQLMNEVELPELSAHMYGVELPQPNRLALIVGFDTETGHDARLQALMESIVEALRKMVTEQTGLSPAIGAGTRYSHSEQLNQSYIEASTAFEASMLNGEGSTTFFNKLSGTQDCSFWVPKDVLLKLVQSLKQGSYDVAVQMVSTALNNLKAEKPAVPLLRCICFDILNTMLKTASELGIHHVVNEIPRVTNFDSLEDLEKKLGGLAADICAQVEAKTETEESSLIEQITAFIDENFTDYDLSLGTISSKYSISSSYFSRSFKEKMGINFSQYIWKKRMDEVIRQLLHTADPLKDIITRVGYLDTPNFIRKFKKEMGCTPGQYRKMHSQNGASVPPDDEDEEYTG
ncbi:helix-turn-helix domain-containing protein [Paenibacillus sp. N3/727]|uniref:helix-turn-helix domain-containing protein n=1 Tax=Paenibacillus sp. N3/727 TaxID=2925845 RepID=UPI001F52B6E6|nr:helix-turn-helix domain-containing protein [Paenibacillus sp. N3/727]UNK18221.1 helix-turn-helix domain-containing protein [Paenibacillus sp. N3/727]